jgi:hypothetical protein
MKIWSMLLFFGKKIAKFALSQKKKKKENL